MPLETGSFVNDLTITNPTSSDPVGQGDDHLRLIKTCLQATLPQMGSALGRVLSIDTATSLSSTWNTNIIVSSASATTTVVLTLPPEASITSGFSLNFFTLGGAAISLLPSGGAASINGAASLAIPERNFATAVFQGGTVWRAGTWPNGVGGVAAFGENVAISGSLSVSGAATLNALSVSGGTVLNGPVTLNTTLSVSGIATFKSAITVSGVSILNGAVTMNGALTVSANATFNSGVSISTYCVVTGNTTLNGTLSLSGAATLNGSLSVSGVTTLNGAAQFNGAITAIDTMSISGAAHFKTTVSIGGATAMNGAVTMNDTLSVSGAFHAKTTASIGGAVTLASTLSVSGAATFKSGISVSGASVLGGGLSVSGATTLSGAVSISGSCFINGAVYMSGTVTISGTLVLPTGQIKFPVSENRSTDANVLDDYEEGTFTPTLSFNVPGTLSVTYSAQSGSYVKIGASVHVTIYLVTATFVPGTATGSFLINGIPFTTVAGPGLHAGALAADGYSLGAGYTQVSLVTAVAGSASLLAMQSGGGVAAANMTVSQWNGATAPHVYASTNYHLRV
jgi:cytoskeletal protein CcmA (bactofilin family)